MPFPPTKIGESGDGFNLLNQCQLLNVLDFPTAVIPIRKIKKNEEFYHCDINDTFSKFVKNQVINSAGLPVGIQIATLPGTDEKCLKLMKFIDNLNKSDS